MAARFRFWWLLIILLLLFANTRSLAQTTNRVPITAANAGQIRQLARIGHGIINAMAWSPDHKTLMVAGAAGLWRYSADQPNSAPRLLGSDADNVTGVAFAPDGKTLAASTNRGIQFWRISDENPLGEPLATKADYLAFSPDGKLLASSGQRGQPGVTLWDVARRQPIGQRFGEGACSLAFSPDGKRLACGFGRIVLWDITDIATAAPVIELKDNVGNFRGAVSVAFSADGNRVAAVDTERVSIWDVKTVRQVDVMLLAVAGRAANLEYDRQGGLYVTLVTGNSLKDTIQRRSVLTRAQLLTIPLGVSGNFRDLLFSPDGTLLASHRAIYGASFTYWWDANTQALIFQRADEPSGVTRFRPDGSMSILNWGIAGVKLWEYKAGKVRPVLTMPNGDLGTFSPDETRLAFVLPDGSIRLVDVRTGNRLFNIPGIGRTVQQLHFSADGAYLAAHVRGKSTNDVWLLDMQTGKQQAVLKDDMGWFSAMVFSPDNRLFATFSDDSVVRLWDRQIGKRLQAWPVQVKPKTGDLSFNADSSRLSFAGNAAGWLWDTQTGRELAHFVRPVNEFIYQSGAAFSPDGKRILFSYTDAIQLHDAETGKQLAQFSRGRPRIVTDFSPDSMQVVNVYENTVQIWDAATGEQLRQWMLPDEIEQWMFSPDQTILLVMLKTGTVSLWDAKTGAQLAELKGHTASLFSVVFSPDRSLLATSSTDGTIRLWGVQR
ncbi:MAG: WD40 repeat domain-containing protein [Anaerolineae bacterium]|nr:WD40 repeat domain-containing protein [Anaerolineae bacterium]